MKFLIVPLLAAALSGCAHGSDATPTLAVVGPNQLQDEHNKEARWCSPGGGSAEVLLHCGVKEIFENDPRAPAYEARFVANIEFVHPLQLGLDGPLDARLELRDRSNRRLIATVDARANHIVSRPELAVAQLVHQMAAGLRANALKQ
jgi:hypothetical protein